MITRYASWLLVYKKVLNFEKSYIWTTVEIIPKYHQFDTYTNEFIYTTQDAMTIMVLLILEIKTNFNIQIKWSINKLDSIVIYNYIQLICIGKHGHNLIRSNDKWDNWKLVK